MNHATTTMVVFLVAIVCSSHAHDHHHRTEPELADKGVMLKDCIVNCARFTHNITAKNVGNKAACELWFKFEECVIGCPGGTASLEWVRKATPGRFMRTDLACSSYRNWSSGHGAQNGSTAKLLIAQDGHSVDLACIQLCNKMFNSPNITSMPRDELCNSFATTMACFKSCKGGEDFVLGFNRTQVKVYRSVRRLCRLKPVTTLSVGSRPDRTSMDQVRQSTIDHGNPKDPISTPSTEQHGNYHDFACMQSCNIILNSLNITSMSREEFCDIFAATNKCFKSCRGGEDFVLVFNQTEVKSYRYARSFCRTQAVPSIRPTPRSAILTEETTTGVSCVDSCESHVSYVLRNQDRLPEVCPSWHTYKHCIDSCPGGLLTLKLAQKDFPRTFAPIVAACEPSGTIALVTSANFVLSSTTSETPPAEPVVSTGKGCIRKCRRMLQGWGIAETDYEAMFCSEWYKVKDCFYSCEDGETFLRIKMMPFVKTYHMIKDTCADPREDKQLNPRLLTTFREEGRVAEQMNICLNKCDGRASQSLTRYGSAGACPTWFEHKRCVRHCQLKDVAMEIFRMSFGKWFELLTQLCNDPRATDTHTGSYSEDT